MLESRGKEEFYTIIKYILRLSKIKQLYVDCLLMYAQILGSVTHNKLSNYKSIKVEIL